jgi:hypothetical protein
LQHHGDYVVELAKQFGNAATDDPKQSNVSYFDVLGWVLVRYGRSTAMFFLGLAGILIAVAVYLGLREKYLRIGASLLGLVCMILAVVVAIGGSAAASWLTFALRRQFPMIRAGLWYHSGLYILAFSALGLACATAFYALVSKRISAENLTVGALLGWFVLAIGMNIYFPGAAYLLLWPLLFSLAGWIAVFAGPNAAPRSKSMLLALSGLPAIALVVPMVHKIFLAFAANSAVIVRALLGLLLALLIGQIVPGTTSRRWLLPVLLAVAGAGLFITAITVSAVDKRHPELSGPFRRMNM